MPFVNIRIYEGWGKERKDEIAKRVTGRHHRRHRAAQGSGVGGDRGGQAQRLVRGGQAGEPIKK